MRSQQDRVKAVFSTLDATGDGTDKEQVMKILTLLESSRFVSSTTAEHIYDQIVEASIRNMSEGKRAKAILLDSTVSGIRVKYKSVAEVVTGRWLVHFAFQKLFAVDFGPLFARVEPGAIFPGSIVKETEV